MTAESVSLNFTKIIMKYQGSDRSSLSFSDVTSDGALSVSSTSPTDVTASQVQASDFLLSMGGIKGSSLVENTSLDHLTLTGGLSISSSSAQDFSLSSASFNYGKIKIDYAGSARSSVAIGDVNGDGRLDIACAGAANATVQDVAASDLSLTLGGIKGAMVTETTDLERITVTGGLFVTCGTAQDFTASSLRGTYIKMRIADVDQQAFRQSPSATWTAMAHSTSPALARPVSRSTRYKPAPCSSTWPASRDRARSKTRALPGSRSPAA